MNDCISFARPKLKNTQLEEFKGTGKLFARPWPNAVEFVNVDKLFVRPEPDVVES